MTRVLKTSGFLGLAVMMTLGLYQVSLLAGGGAGPPGWMVGTHAHLGVLSIIAIVTGVAVEALEVVGTLRRAVTGLFLVGQWMLPASIWLGEGMGITVFLMTIFLWGLCLVVAMLLMAWQAATVTSTVGSRPSGVPADD